MNQKSILLLDDESRRLVTLALEKYKREIDLKMVGQKSQLKSALYKEEKGLIQRTLRRMYPINKDLLPTIVPANK